MAFLGCVLLFLAMISSADSRSRVKRVVGGDRYDDGDYPFHVSLWQMSDDNPYTVKTPGWNHNCGGSLIAPQWVLTLGACFEYDIFSELNDTSTWQVVLGMSNQTAAPQDAIFMTIESVFLPPEYDFQTYAADIALLKLTEEAPLGERIGLVNYNTDTDCPGDDVMAEVIGWGQTDSEEYGLGSDYAYVGEVNVTSLEYCHDVYAEEDVMEAMYGLVIDDTFICAGLMEGGVGACYGDAGSPLLYQCNGQETVIGIVSTGYGCAPPKYPNVYTRVSSFSDWITQTIAEN